MELVADLHVHSRFSRATSRDLDFRALHRAALEKGIGLVGTGDFTHPGWMAEIEDQLVAAEDGLFRLQPDLAREVESALPGSCHGEVRFVLQVEISNIYKRDGRVRKNHNLVYLPGLDAARSLTERLESIGNVASDGRPILGLDARHLLEMVLECDPLAFLLPAHIWTPWFSLFGSKSGFDSIEECYGDLSGQLFAAETGLSSDPPMNWRLSQLDRLTLISNSDAHSAANLGREANLLDIDLGFEPLRNALETRRGFLGTLEFHPEEGKYHLDGHRKCQLRLEPDETRELGGRCPECGGVLTVGVLSRVHDLADRPDGFRPEGAREFRRLVPLAEAVGEAEGVGPKTLTVRRRLELLRCELGSELGILRELPLEEISRVGGVRIAEAIRRVRTGELTISAGYDGEFGTVRIFGPGERERLSGQLSLASPGPGCLEPSPKTTGSTPGQRPGEGPTRPRASRSTGSFTPGRTEAPGSVPLRLSPEQAEAVAAGPGPLLVVAGPGTGKTRTLVSRIARQVESGHVRPDQALAVTFTNQAALELMERIRAIVPGARDGAPLVTTFHGLGNRLLEETLGRRPEVIEDDRRLEIVRACVGSRAGEARTILGRLSLAKQSPDPEAGLPTELAELYAAYQRELDERRVVDVDDLVLGAYGLLREDPNLATSVRRRFPSISVDEYQDVNDVQAALVGLLAPDGTGLTVIGDPDQSIYGFRGSRPGHFRRFAESYPASRVVRLGTSYRLTRNIAAAAGSVLTTSPELQTIRDGPRVELIACRSAAAEAELIVVRLERLVGGTSSFAVDSGRGDVAEEQGVGFGDIAVLSRTRTQRQEILQALDRSGIPCHGVGDDEPHDPRSEKVAVMTMHAAKGRELAVVFVTGVEQGLVPIEREGFAVDQEEERRLLFVAMTRASRRLIVSFSRRRRLWGRALPGAPSPFLARLPSSAVQRLEVGRTGRVAQFEQLDLF